MSFILPVKGDVAPPPVPPSRNYSRENDTGIMNFSAFASLRNLISAADHGGSFAVMTTTIQASAVPVVQDHFNTQVDKFQGAGKRCPISFRTRPSR